MKISSVGAASYIRTKDQSAGNVDGNAIAVQSAVTTYHNHYGVIGDNSNGGGEQYYYNIPIGEILDKFTKNGYVKGANFAKNSITLEFSGLDSPGTLYIASYYQAMYQFAAGSALLVF